MVLGRGGGGRQDYTDTPTCSGTDFGQKYQRFVAAREAESKCKHTSGN